MKDVNKKNVCSAYCVYCGEKIPLIRRFSISIFKGAECPKCHSYMTFNKKYFAFQIFLFLMLFPMLALFEKNMLFGFLGLLGIILISFLTACKAKLIKQTKKKVT